MPPAGGNNSRDDLLIQIINSGFQGVYARLDSLDERLRTAETTSAANAVQVHRLEQLVYADNQAAAQPAAQPAQAAPVDSQPLTRRDAAVAGTVLFVVWQVGQTIGKAMHLW